MKLIITIGVLVILTQTIAFNRFNTLLHQTYQKSEISDNQRLRNIREIGEINRRQKADEAEREAEHQSLLERIRNDLMGRPLYPYAEDILRASEANQLDWRYLVAVHIAEQGNGCPKSNCFGYSANHYAKIGNQVNEIYFIAKYMRSVFNPYNSPGENLCYWNKGSYNPCDYTAVNLFGVL